MKILKIAFLSFTALVLTIFVYVCGCAMHPFAGENSEPFEFSANIGNLRHDVQFLSDSCHPRDASSPENQKRAADYIANVFQASGAVVERQAYRADGLVYENIIGRFEGRDSASVVVLGAHYDSAAGTPGADDNASGVAGILEIARHIRSWGTLGRTVEVVAYNTEEPPYFGTPFMGSCFHAKRLLNEYKEVRGVLILEMIGFFSNLKIQNYPEPAFKLFYPSTADFIALVGRFDEPLFVYKLKRAMSGVSPLALYSLGVPPSVPGTSFSDHRNYWAYDFPSVMITNTAFMRNANYHTAADTAGTLDYSRMAQAVRMTAAALRELLK